MPQESKPATIHDVAKIAGVSTATISRVINEPGKVRERTRMRVTQAIDQLGYTPSFGGRLLAAGRSGTFGAVIPTMANAMFANGIQTFQDVLSQAGRTLLVASTGYDPENELPQIRTLVSRGAEGLLLIGNQRTPECWEYLRRIPHVITWTYTTEPDRVFAGFDNIEAAYDMTRHVLAQGHRDIAVISGITPVNDRARDRQKGVRDAVRTWPDARICSILEVPYDPGEGASAFRQIMAGSDRPTAIICGNDVLAAGAILAARESQIQVPEQVSIVGFDDIDLAALSYPALTTVRVPQRRMGTRAAEMLLDMVDGKGQVESVLFPATIVQRASLAPPPARKAA